MKNKIENDEINLIEISTNMWANKLKIAAITLVFIASSVLLQTIFNPPINSKTKILPITIFEDNLYSSYNALIDPKKKNDPLALTSYNVKEKDTLPRINKKFLLDLFIAELKTRKTIQEAIKKYQILDQKKYDSEDEYLKEIEKIALKLNLLAPLNVDSSQKVIRRDYWEIQFKIHDIEKWEKALKFIETEINNKVREYVILNFNLSLKNLKLLKNFKLEDLEVEIKNLKKDYDKETINQLAFLKEQALIARKLNIENNTLEVENFNTSTGIIANLQTERPYYMSGFSMIEKEIELIETRSNKDAFTKNLYEKEKEIRKILLDKHLSRIEMLFNNTPVVKNSNNFKAANIVYKNIEYKAPFSLTKIILFAGILGVIFGIFFVAISNIITIERKK
jgi:hypothetical protein